ncbi:hypothetical protein [Cellulosimicrobium cellulans]|uniref:hypothetical protein n=1 Tax=Cellulosimicrobium cellulans TaxID=1710 RepID=UPI0012FE4234|nr:hypothetical protein [Cellulosimicrobium cellulans]
MDRLGYHLNRRGGLRLPNYEALEAVVDVLRRYGRGGTAPVELRGRHEYTPTESLDQFLASDNERLAEVTVRVEPYQVTLSRTFVSITCEDNYTRPDRDLVTVMNAISSAVETNGRKVTLLDRIRRRPVVEPRRRSEAQTHSVTLKAAWIGALGGIVGGALSGWLAAVATLGKFPW